MIHLHEPQMLPFLQMGSGSFNFGVFMYIISECGSNMGTNKTFLAFYHSEQHVDNCFQYLSHKEAQNVTQNPKFTFVRHVSASFEV